MKWKRCRWVCLSIPLLLRSTSFQYSKKNFSAKIFLSLRFSIFKVRLNWNHWLDRAEINGVQFGFRFWFKWYPFHFDIQKKFFYILLTHRNFSKCRLWPTSNCDKMRTTGSIEVKQVSLKSVFDSLSYGLRFVSISEKKIFGQNFSKSRIFDFQTSIKSEPLTRSSWNQRRWVSFSILVLTVSVWSPLQKKNFFTSSWHVEFFLSVGFG